MGAELKHYAVNWQGGMKVSYRHFIALEDFIAASLQNVNTVHLNSGNFGLLPAVQESHSSLDWQCELIAGNQIKVVVSSCRIVTAGGIHIERCDNENAVSGLGWIDCVYPLKDDTEKILDVIIGIDPDHRIEIGEPDPKEEPVRRPFTKPRVTVAVRAAGEPVRRLTELKIGEIVVDKGKIEKSADYIPPCATMSCYLPLLKKYELCKEYLLKIEDGVISETRLLKTKFASEAFLHENLKYLSDCMANFLAGSVEKYNRILPESSPLYFVEYFASFARVVDTALRCMDNEMKNYLLNTFIQTIHGFTIANFLDALTKMQNLQYDHQKTMNSIAVIENFLKEMARLFDALPKLQGFYIEPNL